MNDLDVGTQAGFEALWADLYGPIPEPTPDVRQLAEKLAESDTDDPEGFVELLVGGSVFEVNPPDELEKLAVGPDEDLATVAAVLLDRVSG